MSNTLALDYNAEEAYQELNDIQCKGSIKLRLWIYE